MASRPSLAVRLTVAFVGVALAAVAALAGLTVWAVRTQVSEIAELRRVDVADAIRDALAEAYEDGSWSESELAAVGALAGTEGATIRVSGTGGGSTAGAGDGPDGGGGTGGTDAGGTDAGGTDAGGTGGDGSNGAGGDGGQGGADDGGSGSGSGASQTATPSSGSGAGPGSGDGGAGEPGGSGVGQGGSTTPGSASTPSSGQGGSSSGDGPQALILPASTTPGPAKGAGNELKRTIVVDGEEVGTVVIRFPPGSGLSTPEARALGNLERIVLIGAVVAAGLAIVVALVVAHRLTRPIRRMTLAASAIEAGDLEARVGRSGPAELGDLAGAFDRMAEALAREDSLRRGLVADVAHELRTPVTILQGNLEEMVAGDLPASTARLGSLHDEVLRLGRIVQDLETLAAAEAAGLDLHRRTVDLSEVAGEAASLLEPWFSAAGVRLEPVLAPVRVEGDPTRLNQIVTNLLTNALKFTPGGGTVEMVVRPDDGAAVVEVGDTGPGIPPEELPHVFERFWRGSTARTTGGSGIGLSVVAELVGAHEGTVEASNAPGSGARFTVRLPAN